jgi:acetyltransferase-like isoleucine patch superfamily enzyme
VLRRAATRAVRSGRAFAPQLRAGSTALRRRAFITRTRLAAEWAHATVKLDIADDVVIGRNVRVAFEPWSTNELHIGTKSSLGDDVLIQLKGGTIRLGDRVEIRHGCVLNVAGELEMDGDNLISWYCVIHCSTRVHLEPMVIAGEHVSLADSSHYYTEPDAAIYHNLRTGSIEIGRNTWLCPKATVTRDAKIGSHCIVGSGSVVVGEIPAGSLASGVPATYRALRLPW